MSIIVITFSLSVLSLWIYSSHQNEGLLKPREVRTIEKQLRAAAGQKLEIDLATGGSVSITGWNKEMVSLKTYMGGKDGNDSEVSAQETSTGVRIASMYAGSKQTYSTSLRFEIQVPKRFNLQVSSAGGSITITDLEGSINGWTGGGELRITGARGTIDLITGGGNISLSRSNLDGKVHTGGGHVFLEEVTGNVKGFSATNDITYKDMTHRPAVFSNEEVRISKAGGGIKIMEAPHGAILRTGGGNISVRSAGRFVTALTGGGKIDIEAVNGAVNASTGGGDVNVTVIDIPDQEGDILLTSGNGDITLTVPPNLSISFDVKLAYTRTDRQYRIVSDFELTQEQSRDSSPEEGTPRAYVHAKGIVADGKHKIQIQTVNGNIYLRKGR